MVTFTISHPCLPEHPLPQLETAGRKVYPVAPQQHQSRDVETAAAAAANFPAILQNSMDKLQMNFIQNKSLSDAPLEYQVRKVKLSPLILHSMYVVQGAYSGCVKPPVDIKTKVTF